MNQGGDDKRQQDSKSKNLNLNAQEYKPKSFGQQVPNMQNMGQNPYAYNNMYNPYGGMYNQNMGNMGYNPMGYNMGYDPNMMGYNNMNDPNMMNQNMANPNNQNYNMMVNDNTMNNITNSNTNNTNQPKPSGGIVGIGGKGKKPTTSTNTTSITNSTQNKNINPNPNVSQATTKPKDTKKETNAPNTITAKPTTASSTKKPAIQTTTVKPKIEEIKETSTIEITKQINEIQLDSKLESVLETDSKEGTMIEVDLTRKPVTIVFIGHVDAGKSTISGSILYKTGQIDERTIDKYRREAKVNNRESWFMAYIMDINEEEKQRGKTVEVGKAFFSTPNKRFTILDAPGHASFVPNMLQGACQADYAGLVISAKTGEFEAGFERDGRTREHSLLAKSLGVHRLIVIVNKMDEETVKWSKDRFDKIKSDLSVYLKSCGYNIEKHVVWIPISGLTGENLMEPVSKHKCAWYEGPTLIEILDKLDLPPRNESSSVRVPILDRYKDQGIFILGKVESGIVKYGGSYTLMPSRIPFEVAWLFDSEERGVPYARPGESIRIKVKGIENESDISRGSVVCSTDDLCPIFTTFECEIFVVDLPEKKQIMANGYQCILHMHTIIEECNIDILGEIDRKTKAEKKVKFIRSQTKARVIIKTSNPICGEKFDKFNQLGRFTLRDEGKTIAIGKILRYKPLK